MSPSLQRRGTARRCRSEFLPSHPPGVSASSTSSFAHRKARLRAEQRADPSKSCPPGKDAQPNRCCATLLFPLSSGRKGAPARRGQRPSPPSGGVSPSCRRSGKIASSNFILGITSFLPAFDAKSGVKAQGLRPLTRRATARCSLLLPASVAVGPCFSSRSAALCPARGQSSASFQLACRSCHEGLKQATPLTFSPPADRIISSKSALFFMEV